MDRDAMETYLNYVDTADYSVKIEKIIEYNRVDCVIMFEILNFLRKKC